MMYRAARLAMCVMGIVGSLVIYGLLQERIMTLPFGEAAGAELFRHSLFLVACNRAVAASISACTLLAGGLHSHLRPVAPIQSYASVSLSNVVAATCQYEALKHVTFAVQTLGKCTKMFPVMLWGCLVLGRRYNRREVVAAAAITAGCFLFFMLGPTASRVAAGADSTLFGVALMGGYLVADGYTSTFQQAMFRGHAMSSANQVLFISLCSLCLSLAGLVAAGQLSGALAFVGRHPRAAVDIMGLSLAASSGSLIIAYTIKTFGALTFATIMTTRQFLSILLSSLLFGNMLAPGQWAGALIVATGLYYQAVSSGSGGKVADGARCAVPAPGTGVESPR